MRVSTAWNFNKPNLALFTISVADLVYLTGNPVLLFVVNKYLLFLLITFFDDKPRTKKATDS